MGMEGQKLVRFIMIKGSHGNGRPKGNEVAVNRSKYGLITFVYLENDKAKFFFLIITMWEGGFESWTSPLETPRGAK